jgi:hypothetical protein
VHCYPQSAVLEAGLVGNPWHNPIVTIKQGVLEGSNASTFLTLFNSAVVTLKQLVRKLSVDTDGQTNINLNNLLRYLVIAQRYVLNVRHFGMVESKGLGQLQKHAVLLNFIKIYEFISYWWGHTDRDTEC